ncbi:hypothetical protein HaLaN_19851, partial [Haematococcus lacustris]
MFSTPSVPGSWLGLLRLQVQGSVVTLQPWRSPGDKAPSLVLDLKTGRVTSVPDAVFHVEEIQLITHEAVKSNTGDLK